MRWPGIQFFGHSVAEPFDAKPQLRLPTVFSPFTAGRTFTLDNEQRPEFTSGTLLMFRNLTILAANETWASLAAHNSSFRQFFKIPAYPHGSRICIANSCASLIACAMFASGHIILHGFVVMQVHVCRSTRMRLWLTS